MFKPTTLAMALATSSILWSVSSEVAANGIPCTYSLPIGEDDRGNPITDCLDDYIHLNQLIANALLQNPHAVDPLEAQFVSTEYASFWADPTASVARHVSGEMIDIIVLSQETAIDWGVLRNTGIISELQYQQAANSALVVYGAVVKLQSQSHPWRSLYADVVFASFFVDNQPVNLMIPVDAPWNSVEDRSTGQCLCMDCECSFHNRPALSQADQNRFCREQCDRSKADATTRQQLREDLSSCKKLSGAVMGLGLVAAGTSLTITPFTGGTAIGLFAGSLVVAIEGYRELRNCQSNFNSAIGLIAQNYSNWYYLRCLAYCNGNVPPLP